MNRKVTNKQEEKGTSSITISRLGIGFFRGLGGGNGGGGWSDGKNHCGLPQNVVGEACLPLLKKVTYLPRTTPSTFS